MGRGLTLPASPFAIQTQTPPDGGSQLTLEERCERAERLGHGLGRVRVAGVGTEPPPGGGRPLPGSVRGKMEAAFRQDFSRVRIYVDRRAEALGALAYTRGHDIHFAAGRYSPASRAGQELLGHELAHVVQ